MVEKVTSDIIVNGEDIDSNYLSSKKNKDTDKATSFFIDKIKKTFITISLGVFSYTAAVSNTKLFNKLNLTKVEGGFFDFLNVKEMPSPLKDELGEWSGFVAKAAFAYSAIIAPAIEEIIFRYGIQQKLLKDLPLKYLPEKYSKFVKSKLATALRILITASLFAAAHYGNKSVMNADVVDMQVKNCFINGIVLGIAKEKFGLLSSIGVHAINNGIFKSSLLFCD